MSLSSWKRTRLGDCGQWYSGGTPNTAVADYWDGDIPWVTASSLHDFYITTSERKLTMLGLENGSRLVPQNTILFVVRGMSLKSEFRVGIARRPVAFGQDCKAIIARAGIAPVFLANVLRAKANEILGLVDEASHGTGRLQTSALSKLEIPVPPLEEQEAIACFVEAFDDKIDLNRRMNATLEAMARALFQAWFVDFEPVRAKEKGWRTETLGQVASINEGKVGKDFPHTEIQYIDISSVSAGRLEGTTRVSWNDAPSRAQRLVQDGDTIWSCVRPNRRSFLYIDEPAGDVVVSTGFAVLRPRTVTPSFLYSWVTTDEFVDYLSNNADGSAYPAVRPDDFARAEILVPDTETLNKFEDIVGPKRKLIAQNERESRTLGELRDALLPKLMSGEVRVRP